MRIYVNSLVPQYSDFTCKYLLEELQIAYLICDNLRIELDGMGFLNDDQWNLFYDMRNCLEAIYKSVQKEQNKSGS